jgi:hypothetical protein
MTKQKETLMKRARELNKAIVSNFFAECDLHIEAQAELGATYTNEMMIGQADTPNQREAVRVRQIAKATHLRKPWLMSHLPPKTRQLTALAAIPSNKAGETFMRDAVKDGCISMSMSLDEAVRLREMFKAIGFYEPSWGKADKDLAQVDAASQGGRTKWVMQLKAKYPKEFEANSQLLHLAEKCVPWGAQEESMTPELALETFKMEVKQHQDAAMRLEKILKLEKLAAKPTNLRELKAA